MTQAAGWAADPFVHPFLGVQPSGRIVYARRLEKTHRSVLVRICKIPVGTPVVSIEHAEDTVLARLLADPAASRTWDPDRDGPLRAFIDQRSNQIGGSPHPGIAMVRHILVHPDTVPLLDFVEPWPVRFGRWTRIGVCRDGQIVYAGPVPRGVVVLIRRGASGAIDAPAFYSETPDGDRHLTWTPQGVYHDPVTNTSHKLVGSALDYAEVIKIA